LARWGGSPFLACWGESDAVFCQLGGAKSLREIGGGLPPQHAQRRRVLGIPVAASEGKMGCLDVPSVPPRSPSAQAKAPGPGWHIRTFSIRFWRQAKRCPHCAVQEIPAATGNPVCAAKADRTSEEDVSS